MAIRHFYDDSIYEQSEFDRPYWQSTCAPLTVPAPADHDTVDVIIIGAGYLGLSAALHLAKQYSMSVAVFEANTVGFGGSGRNGGQNAPAATKLAYRGLVKSFGEEQAARFLRTQAEGQHLVLKLAEEENIDLDQVGDGVICAAHSRSAYNELIDDAEIGWKLAGLTYNPIPSQEFQEQVHSSPGQFGGVRLWPGCGINPLKFTHGLARAALRHGVSIHENCRITGQTYSDNRHRVHTSRGSCSAKHLIYATNAYLADGIEQALDARMVPAITNVMVTRVLTEEELQAHNFLERTPLYSSHNLLCYYRRLSDNRILFGARGDLSGSERAATGMRRALHRHFSAVFPEWREIPADFFWRGLVSLTLRKTPAMGKLPADGSAWFGFGCHGNGINNQTWMGREIARMVAGETSPDALPVAYRGLPRSFPRSRALRRGGLRTAYATYSFLDRIS